MRTRKIRLRLNGRFAGALALLTVIAACLHCGGEDATISKTSQALTPTPYEVMPDADSLRKYAAKCGLVADTDRDLPALGTAATPIRGTITPADVGTLVSNGWRLIQSFENKPEDLAASESYKANLWYKRAGSRDWYYLYRFQNPDPQVQITLNGVLGFDATSICAFDRKGPRNPPPPNMDYLYFAGETEASMDDCSSCHVEGYIAPRAKSFAVAKDGTSPTANPVKWIGPWKSYAAAFGPQWKLGKAPTAYQWVSGQGTDLLTTDDACSGCHGTKWIKPRDTSNYCESVFATAFDANGSMSKQGHKFPRDPMNPDPMHYCTAFVSALGCPTSICSTAVAVAPPLPRVNETTLLVGDIRVIDSTTVQITPMQNPDNRWIAGTASAIGDHWLASLQVWGAHYTGSPTSTSPMTGIISISNPDALSPILVTGLTTNTQYIFQLNTTDVDNSTAFSPPAIISTAVNDFSISANPSSLTVSQGTSGTSAINTAVTSGSAQSVSLSISGVPSGASASFSPNPITSGGSSTLTINAGTASPSTYALTVTGTGASATHTTTVTLTVRAPVPNDFSIGANPSTVTVAQHHSRTSTISTAVISGSTQSVHLSISGVPSGASASFSPNPISSGASSTLTLDAGTAAPGTYHLVVTGAGTSVMHSTAVTLVIPRNDFSISASPSRVSVARGRAARYTVRTAVISGNPQTMTLSVSGLPAGTTARFTPTSITAGGSSTLRVATTGSTPTGDHPLTITGTAASGSNSVQVVLNVR